MSQNINLFNPAFRKQPRTVTLGTVAQLLLITLATLGGYHYTLQTQVNGLTEELRSSDSLLKSQRGYVDRLKGKAAAKPDAQLENDIARLEAELKAARDSTEALKGGGFGYQRGFSEYLRAFSRQSLNGLWLTGFTISGAGELEIRGRVLSPDLVPSFIQRLNREQVLAGRSFARLEMNRPPEPVPDKGKDAKKAPPAPRFLEFSMATSDRTGTGKTP
jgi:hypothetical protein